MGPGPAQALGGGRVAAHEILLGTTAVSALIREGKTYQMGSIMQTSKQQGMVTLNDALFGLVQRNLVDAREAWLARRAAVSAWQVERGEALEAIGATP